MWFELFTSSVLNRMLAHPQQPNAAGLRLGVSVEPPFAPVVLSDERRCEHVVILGKTGTGKTYLLEYLAWQIAKLGQGFAFFDFHGDASLSLIARLKALPDAGHRLIVIDPSHPTLSPAINVLEAGGTEAERFRKVSELSSILRQRWAVDSFGARTEELLRNSLYTLTAASLTLADLPKLLTDVRFRQHQASTLDHPDIELYWRERFEPLSEPMKAAFREPLLNKVTAFLTEPAARHLLGQRGSTVDLASAMRNRSWVIVRLPKGRLREHAHTLGNLLFAHLQFAAMAREALPPSARTTFTLVCDEVQNLAENDLATLLTEGRKFGISIITANQFWEQLSRELRGALLSANAHVCFRISTADAQILSGELNLERRNRLTLELTQLSRGEAIARLNNQGAMRVKVPALPQVPPVDPDGFDAIVGRVARSRTAIEQSLRQLSAQRPEEPSVLGSDSVEEGQHDW